MPSQESGGHGPALTAIHGNTNYPQSVEEFSRNICPDKGEGDIQYVIGTFAFHEPPKMNRAIVYEHPGKQMDTFSNSRAAAS